MLRVEFQIRNIVATGSLGVPIRPQDLLRALPGAKLEHRKATTVQYRIPVPGVTVLATSTGKVILTGAKSVADVESAYAIFLGECTRGGIDAIKPGELRVRNIVATVDFATTLNLSALAEVLIESERFEVSYEPEIFPGIVLRASNATSLLVFGSGKCVCTGGRDIADYRGPLAELSELRDAAAPLL